MPAAAEDTRPAFTVEDAGYTYELTNLGEGTQTLQFIRKDVQENGELATTIDGTTTEVVLAVVANRLSYFLEGALPDDFTREALEHVEKAIAAIDARTADREARGVKGKHEA